MSNSCKKGGGVNMAKTLNREFYLWIILEFFYSYSFCFYLNICSKCILWHIQFNLRTFATEKKIKRDFQFHKLLEKMAKPHLKISGSIQKLVINCQSKVTKKFALRLKNEWKLLEIVMQLWWLKVEGGRGEANRVYIQK